MVSLMHDRTIRSAFLHTDERHLKGWLKRIRTYRGPLVRKVRRCLNAVLRRQGLMAPTSVSSLVEGTNSVVNALKLAETYGLFDVELANAMQVPIPRDDLGSDYMVAPL